MFVPCTWLCTRLCVRTCRASHTCVLVSVCVRQCGCVWVWMGEGVGVNPSDARLEILICSTLFKASTPWWYSGKRLLRDRPYALQLAEWKLWTLRHVQPLRRRNERAGGQQLSGSVFADHRSGSRLVPSFQEKKRKERKKKRKERKERKKKRKERKERKKKRKERKERKKKRMKEEARFLPFCYSPSSRVTCTEWILSLSVKFAWLIFSLKKKGRVFIDIFIL